MDTLSSRIGDADVAFGQFGPLQLLNARQLCAALGMSLSWIYKRTQQDHPDPLPVVRIGDKGVRFDPYKVFLYIRARERHRPADRLGSSDGIARVSGKAFTLTRKRFQTGSVRLRTDRGPAYWQGFYWDDIITEAGKTVRKRFVANLGSLKDVPNEKVARQKLGVILNPINGVRHKPRQMMSFCGFIQKYRALKLVNQKGTTVHGYETNIRAHYLPEFGDRELSDISAEDVQTFLNQKRLEGKAVQTLKNLKWGLSSIFESAIKFGYIKFNPARSSDLPPEEVKEDPELPTPADLIQLIEALPEPYSTMVYLVSVSSIRPEELAFKWSDLKPEICNLEIVRAMNKGKFHTPKYQKGKRILRLTKADVARLLTLKRRMHAQDDDWMFRNRIKNGTIRKPGPIWHEHVLARQIQPVARRLGLPHITWRLLRHWGATQLVGGGADVKVVQQRLGHSRASTTMNYYAHVIDARADAAAGMMSRHLGYEIPPEFSVNPVEV
jgi:integrase/predicted DNA-binding transcriptional regulator AlpA